MPVSIYGTDILYICAAGISVLTLQWLTGGCQVKPSLFSIFIASLTLRELCSGQDQEQISLGKASTPSTTIQIDLQAEEHLALHIKDFKILFH